MTEFTDLREFALTAQPGDTLTAQGGVRPDDRSLRTYIARERLAPNSVQAEIVSTSHAKQRGGGQYVSTRSVAPVTAETYVVSVQYGNFMQNSERIATVDARPRYSIARHRDAHAVALALLPA